MKYNRVNNFSKVIADMKQIGNWFRNITAHLSAGLRQFMTGRYGTDRLNMLILGAGLVCCLLSSLLRQSFLCVILVILSYGLMIWAIFRMLSKNTYKRYEENRKYLMLINRLKDRDNRYFTCPKCRQTVRVPRGKGKVAITCPRCKERFVKKT